jgi:antitoxin component of MazEF toxin-antitoxin module
MVEFAWTKVQKIGNSHYIRVPPEVLKDEAFPFKINEAILFKIIGDKVEIKKE